MKRREILKGAGAAALAGGMLPAAFGAQAQPSSAGEAYDWRSVPFGGGGYVAGLVFHPREAGLLYARTDAGGAFRFDAASASWVPLLDHLSREDAQLMGVLSLAVDPAEPNRLYAACGQYTGQWSRKGALLASDDRGTTWRSTELGFWLGGADAGRGTGERLQVDPNQGDTLLLGTSYDGLMLSTDRGKSFRKLDFPSRHVSLVLFDPASGQRGNASTTLYAGGHDKPGLYASRDGGRSFSREAGAPEQVPQRAVFGPDGSLYVSFALSNSEAPCNPGNVKTGGVWKRDPQGRWRDITPVPPGRNNQNFGYAGLDVDRQVPGRLLVSTLDRWGEGDDIFMSADDGAHWLPLGPRSRHQSSAYAAVLANHLRGADRMGYSISDLKIDPFGRDRAVYGTSFGLFITDNLGAAQQPGGTVNWDFAVANLELARTTELKSPTEGASLLAAMSDVSGSGWDNIEKPPGAGLFIPPGESNRSIDHAELSPVVVVRTAEQATTGGYVSLNGGISWRPFGPATRASRAPNGDYLGVGRVAVSAKGGFLLWAPDRQPALWSADLGKTWKASAGWPATRDVALTPVADRALEGVFYVHDRPQGQIFISVDGGASFKPVIKGLPTLQGWQSAQLLSAPGTPRDLWLALPDALMYFAGPDKGAKTIKNVAEPWLIALGKGASGAQYHSLYVWGRVIVGGKPVEGLFRSDDAGASFKRINDDRHRYGQLTAMAGDSLEHGMVYLAAQGRGVIVGRPHQAGG